MNNICQDLDNIIDRLKNDKTQDLDREEIIEKAGQELSLLHDIKEFKYEYCGGFDSPGYTVHYYAIAFIDEDRELGLYSCNFEIM